MPENKNYMSFLLITCLRFPSTPYSECCKQHKNAYRSNDYNSDKSPVKTLLHNERNREGSISLGKLFLDGYRLIGVLACRYIIGCVEFDLGLILTMVICCTQHLPIQDDSSIRNHFLVFVLNKECQICIFK